MVRCAVCNKMVVTNAKVIGEVRVCSDKCLERSAPMQRAEAAVAEQVRALRWAGAG